MTLVDKNIVDTYTDLLEGLESSIKLELIDRLSKSLKKEKVSADNLFYESFGSFPEEKSPEEIIAGIKSSRKFRKKDINF